MRNMKIFLITLLTVCSFEIASANDSIFQIDKNLINKLTENKICLIVMRQPEATNNTKKIITSARTPGFSLTPRGNMEINMLRPLFSTLNIFKIFTSPLYRCLQATQMFRESLGLAVDNLVVDDRLVIQEFGIYERYPYSVYNNLFNTVPEMLEATLEGMESGADLFARTNNFLWHIANNVSNETVLVMTHAFNFSHISKALTGEYGRIVHPAEYVIYDFSGN